MERETKIDHLIVDTAAFILHYSFIDLAANLLTTDEILNEIRSEQARINAHLNIKDIVVRQPTIDSIKFVKDAAMRTGDLRVLSKADISLLALAVDIANEINYDVKLPPIVASKGIVPSSKVSRAPPLRLKPNIAGFVNGKTSEENNKKLNLSENSNNDVQNVGDSAEGSESSSESANDDDNGWITPSNIDEAIAKVAIDRDEEEFEPTGHLPIAVITCDYAMQNVIMHMGIDVLSPSGKKIKRLRHYVMRCNTCFTVTRDTNAQFCPKCGYKAMSRINAIIDPESGHVQLCLSTQRLKNPRPPRNDVEIAPPIGGKHGRLEKISEDQKLPQNRASKKTMMHIDALNDDYTAQHYSAPFKMHDVTSKSAMLGIHRNNQRKTRSNNSAKRGGKRH